jgi:tetratricopeptide (TPR) repeat protein
MAQRVLIRHVLQARGRAYTVGKFLIGGGVVVMLALALMLWFSNRLWNGTASDAAPLTKAYEALEQGHPQEAEVRFKSLLAQAETAVQSQGYAGLSAVAFTHHNYVQALELASRAQTLDAESIYSHVLRGHVLLHQGKTTEAAAAYRTATEKTRGFPWQKAMAYNRLGRIAAAEGNAQQALEHYDKALNQPRNSQQEQALAYTNKGHVLEKLGKYREALALYRQAQALQPDNRLTDTLLREAERRAKLTQDQEQQERIDKLVAELLQLHKDGRPPPDPGDGWTSSRLTLAFLPMQARGTVSAQAGEEDFLFLRLVDTLQATGRVTVVERELLEKVLAELKLSAAEFVDQQAAVHMGRILAARLLATGNLTRLGPEAQFSLRVVETESTRLKAALTEIIALPFGIDRVAEQLAITLLHKLRVAYPLQGRIVQVMPAGILLNIGREHGMTPGLKLEVFGAEEPLRVDGQVIGYQRPHVGLIEVTSFQDRFAQATVLEQTVPLVPGWKVKEVQEP